MPDWITHILFVWASCTLLSFKFKDFNPANTSIAMIGSLIPDLNHLTTIFLQFGLNLRIYMAPFHMPIGSLIIALLISFMFKEKKIILMFLSFGVFTHYCLDLLLINVDGGIMLFYPFSWHQFQLNIISANDYHITILMIIISIMVFLISKLKGKGIKTSKTIRY